MTTSSQACHKTSGRLEAVPAVRWIALFAVLLRLIVAALTRFTNEDAYITLRYAVHIAQGQGFVYNPGEHVLGTTTPLYTLLLALFQRLGLPALACGKLLNILAEGALCMVIARWVRAIEQGRGTGECAERAGEAIARSASSAERGPALGEGGKENTPIPNTQYPIPNTRTPSGRRDLTAIAGIVAALAVALNPVQIRWSISGMETGLVTLCGTWIWLCYTERRYYAAYSALGLLFLLRWDSTLLLLVLSLAMVIRERRLPWRELLLYAVLILPWLLFAFHYFGSPIPITAASKMTVYGWRASHDPHRLGRYLPQLGKLLSIYLGNLGSVLISLAAGIGIYRTWREGIRAVVPPLVWSLLYWIAFLLSRVLLFPWYVVPPLPVYELLAAIGIAEIGVRGSGIPLGVRGSGFGDREEHRVRWSGGAYPALGWSMVVVGFVAVGVAMTLSCGENERTEGAQNREIGLWLKAHARPTDHVMLEPIGYIGYYSGLPVIDVVGLVTPETLFAYTPQNRAPMREIALRYRPEWCVLRPGEVQHIQDADQVSNHEWSDLYTVAHVFTMLRPGKEPIIFTVYRRRDPHPQPPLPQAGDGAI